jgi:hypothetical protein
MKNYSPHEIKRRNLRYKRGVSLMLKTIRGYGMIEKPNCLHAVAGPAERN